MGLVWIAVLVAVVWLLGVFARSR